MSLFLLDTNMASFAMKRHYPQVRTHLARAAKKHGIGISAMTQGELIYGLHRKDAPNELVEQLSRASRDHTSRLVVGQAAVSSLLSSCVYRRRVVHA